MSVTVVILTYNEAVHIERAIANVKNWAQDVFVVDSYSSDQTCQLAEAAGAQIFQHRFENYAAQREWALRQLPYKTAWMLFLDADELISNELKQAIDNQLMNTSDNIAGYYLRRKFYWMGKPIIHGGIYPTWILRLIRHEAAHCNSRTVNEHIEVTGKTPFIEDRNADLIHKDLKPITDWVGKHNRYAQMEAMELLKGHEQDSLSKFFGVQAERKRWIRQHIWNPLLPPLLRPFLMFFYRYIIRLGFLDGKAGFIYHFLQGLWFPFLIDVKYLELKWQQLPNKGM